MDQQMQPPSIMLLGAVGSGKTYSISTLAKAGLDVFVIITEPTGLDSLLDAWEKEKLPIEKLHWHVIQPARSNFDGLLKLADVVSIADYKHLAEQKPQGNRSDAKFKELLRTLANFKSDRTGESFGPVEDFPPTRALVIDSLSGVNTMAMDIVIGDKLSAHQGEWGVAMKLLQNLFTTLCSNLKCIFVITAHAEKEPDEVTGINYVTVSTLGRKLAPVLPRFFSEVVMAKGEDGKYSWSTAAVNTALKARALPIAPKIEPSFEPIVRRYHERLKFASNTSTAEGENEAQNPNQISQRKLAEVPKLDK